MTNPGPEFLEAPAAEKRQPLGSAASRAARERLNASYRNQPLIDPPYDPVDAINRAKRAGAIPAPETNALNPTGVAESDMNKQGNGDTVDAERQPYTTQPSTALPETINAQARASLEAAGLTTLAAAAALTDAELDGISGVGTATITAIREAAQAAGLPAPEQEGQ